MTGIGALVGAIALIALGGLFAAIDAAISTVSLARVEELVRDERPGAVRLARVMAERPRYINLDCAAAHHVRGSRDGPAGRRSCGMTSA